MLLFSFACPKEKVTKKEKDKGGFSHFQEYPILGATKPLRLHPLYQDAAIVKRSATFPESVSFFIQINTSLLVYFSKIYSTNFSEPVDTHEKIKRLSSFPQDFFSGATEKKG